MPGGRQPGHAARGRVRAAGLGRRGAIATAAERHAKDVRLRSLQGAPRSGGAATDGGIGAGDPGRKGTAAKAGQPGRRRTHRTGMAGAVGGHPAVPRPPTVRRASRGAMRRSGSTRTRGGWRSSCLRRLGTSRTGRTGATGCRARSRSATAVTRSPRRPPPAPSATTSPSIRPPGAGTSTPAGRSIPGPVPALDQLQAPPSSRGRRQRRAPRRRCCGRGRECARHPGHGAARPGRTTRIHP